MSYDEPFGPEYVRPANADCPDCVCCTTALCERGRASVMKCAGHVDGPHRETVRECPCSAESTRGTLSWRAAKIRAVTAATTAPLSPAAEELLKAIAQEEAVTDAEGTRQLVLRGYVDFAENRPVATEFGRTYLTARTEPRFSTTVYVEAVDPKARAASVIIAGWHTTTPVTVPLDLLLIATGLKAEELTGRFLEAVANCEAGEADDLVLTDIRGLPHPAPAATVEPAADGAL